MVKKDYRKIKGFTDALSKFKGTKHKTSISKVLRDNSKVKKNTHISAYDPSTRQFFSGSLAEVSDALGVSSATVGKRLKSGSSEMKDVKGFIIGRHKSAENMIDYRNVIKSEDKFIPKVSKNNNQGNYKIENAGSHENKVFGYAETRFSLSVNNELTIDDIGEIFQQTIDTITKQNKLEGGRDKVRLVIIDDNLSHPISTGLIDLSDVTPSMIMGLVEQVIESNEEFMVSSDTEIIITSVNGTNKDKRDKERMMKKTKYKGYKSNEIDLADDVSQKVYGDEDKSHTLNTSFKKSIIKIKNKDDLCVPRAIATGFFLATKGVDSLDYKYARMGRKIQLDKALELVAGYETLTGEKYEGGGFSVDALLVFEKLTGCQITAVDGQNSLNIAYPLMDKGCKYVPPEDESNTIYLYLNKVDGLAHCDLINNTRVAGFFGRHYFCHKCKKCYEKKDCHKCSHNCKMCCKPNCPTIMCDKSKIKYSIECADCYRFFPNETCYDNHKITTTIGLNGRTLKNPSLSTCDRVWKCQDCKKIMKRNIQPPLTHICGDYLCSNCKDIVREDHKCYMLPKKLNDPKDKYIYFDFESDIEEKEGKKEHEVMFAISMYHNSPEPIQHHTIDEWCNWAFGDDNEGHTFIAHNGMGYDYRFIIKWIYENTIYKPFVIWGGQKIITMSIKELGIRFIDSLSFLTMPLKAFPKTFGQTELKKGYFPHWFNTLENRNYVGVMPSVEMFKPERMDKKSYGEFMKWYKEKIDTNYVWDEEKEMREYCISDVDILRKCCIQFRDIYLDVANIDPFSYLTIASVCMAIYKYYYIDETFPFRTEQLRKFKDSLGCHPSKLQGQALEMWNCVVKKYDTDTLDNVFSEKKIAIFSFEDVEWMRNAFFGGRTNATKLIYKFKKGEEGIYSDITSLYPTVNFYDIYPKGHPIIISGDDIDINVYKKLYNREYLGFLDIEVNPPKDLYHPVLPTKGDKLTFDLLEKRGVWCSNEVYVAMDMGYEITKIHEIRYFEEGTKSLFKGYVSKFLKIKQEASGFPDWVLDPSNPKSDCPEGYERKHILLLTLEDRQDLYIHLYEEGQQILLDKSKITYNPGMRAIAKLCLNSLWGKFGQRTNMGASEVISTKEEFFKIIYNPKYENINWIDIAEDKLQISYVLKDEYVENDYNTNMAIACFTTSRARMRLYEEALQVLDRQVLYFDTDSVVYVYDSNNPKHYRLKNGDLLGDWTDELEGDKMVGTFVSGGPKNYSYELLTSNNETKYKTKVKGFTLNKETCGLINHNSILTLIEDSLFTNNHDEHKIVANWHGIKRVDGCGLENISMEKKYGLCYTKRAICRPDEFGNYDTRPFGWDYKANGDWD